MIPGRKYPSLSYSYLVSFLDLMTHIVQAKDSLHIHITAVNIKIKQKSNYNRIFLFRGVESSIGQVVYMVEGKSSNEEIWGLNNQVRDNGVLTIGYYITICNPFPILNRLENKIPIIESRYSAVITEPPRMVHSVCDEFGLIKNNTRVFVLNNAHITINSCFPEVKKC